MDYLRKNCNNIRPKAIQWQNNLKPIINLTEIIKKIIMIWTILKKYDIWLVAQQNLNK